MVTLEVLANIALLNDRGEDRPDLSGNEHGMGRELFRAFRQIAGRPTKALRCSEKARMN
jgi:phosphogluconate dehydratase